MSKDNHAERSSGQRKSVGAHLPNGHLGLRTIMRGSYPTTRNYKIVLLNHTSARINSSNVGKTLPRRRSPRREKV